MTPMVTACLHPNKPTEIAGRRPSPIDCDLCERGSDLRQPQPGNNDDYEPPTKKLLYRRAHRDIDGHRSALQFRPEDYGSYPGHRERSGVASNNFAMVTSTSPVIRQPATIRVQDRTSPPGGTQDRASAHRTPSSKARRPSACCVWPSGRTTSKGPSTKSASSARGQGMTSTSAGSRSTKTPTTTRHWNQH